MTRPVNDTLAGFALARGASAGATPSRTALESGAFAGLFDSSVEFAPWQHDLAQAPERKGTQDAVKLDDARRPLAQDRPDIAVDLSSAGAPREGGVPVEATGIVPGARGQAVFTGSIERMAVGSSTKGAAPAMPQAVRYQWSRTALAVCVRDGELSVSVRDSDISSAEDLRRALEQSVPGLRLSSLKVNGVLE